MEGGAKLDLILSPQAQVILALAVSVFGFRIFRLMVSRVVGLLQAVGTCRAASPRQWR